MFFFFFLFGYYGPTDSKYYISASPKAATTTSYLFPDCDITVQLSASLVGESWVYLTKRNLWNILNSFWSFEQRRRVRLMRQWWVWNWLTICANQCREKTISIQLATGAGAAVWPMSVRHFQIDNRTTTERVARWDRRRVMVWTPAAVPGLWGNGRTGVRKARFDVCWKLMRW